MNAPAPSSGSLRYFAMGVLCVAGLLGVYFIQFNAQVDRQREEAAERLALCRHLERVTEASASSSNELRQMCKQLSEQVFNRARSP